MYSERVLDIFGKIKAKVGDNIRLHTKKGVFEGIIMPRPDIGDKDVLIIKLKSGYNFGIRLDSDMKLEKIKLDTKEKSNKKILEPKSSKLPKISIIYTGGTIGTVIDYVTGGVYMLKKPQELLGQIPELNDIARIDVNNLMSKASEDMDYKDWFNIAQAVADSLNNGARGVVITHGTDTMHYTAAALSFMLEGLNAPVVLTGSQRSSDRGSSDAFLNLICSSYFATKSDIAEVGICMHENSSDKNCIFIRGTKARKMHTSARDAFKPINSHPVAKVDDKGNMQYISSYSSISKEISPKVRAIKKFEPKVAIIKAYPNSDPEIINYYTHNGYKGMIIEGTGLGHVPVAPNDSANSWIKNIKESVESGAVIGITSQSLYGKVNDRVYRNLRLLKSAGAIHCEDMLTEVAYVKLGFLLASKGSEQAKSFLAKNIAGEITKRTEIDTFM